METIRGLNNILMSLRNKRKPKENDDAIDAAKMEKFLQDYDITHFLMCDERHIFPTPGLFLDHFRFAMNSRGQRFVVSMPYPENYQKKELDEFVEKEGMEYKYINEYTYYNPSRCEMLLIYPKGDEPVVF